MPRKVYIPDVETGVKLVQGWYLPHFPTRLLGTSTKLILPQSHTSQIGPPCYQCWYHCAGLYALDQHWYILLCKSPTWLVNLSQKAFLIEVYEVITQQRPDKETKNRERLRTTEEIFTLGFDCVTPILEIHLGNTMTWFMWGSNLFWWLNRYPFTLNQLGHLLCCWQCNLSVANFCLYTHLVVCSLGLTAWVVRTATGCVTFASGPFH